MYFIDSMTAAIFYIVCFILAAIFIVFIYPIILFDKSTALDRKKDWRAAIQSCNLFLIQRWSNCRIAQSRVF